MPIQRQADEFKTSVLRKKAFYECLNLKKTSKVQSNVIFRNPIQTNIRPRRGRGPSLIRPTQDLSGLYAA